MPGCLRWSGSWGGFNPRKRRVPDLIYGPGWSCIYAVGANSTSKRGVNCFHISFREQMRREMHFLSTGLEGMLSMVQCRTFVPLPSGMLGYFWTWLLWGQEEQRVGWEHWGGSWQDHAFLSTGIPPTHVCWSPAQISPPIPLTHWFSGSFLRLPTAPGSALKFLTLFPLSCVIKDKGIYIILGFCTQGAAQGCGGTETGKRKGVKYGLPSSGQF